MGPGIGMMQAWYDEKPWNDDGTPLGLLVPSATNQ